MSNIIDRFSFFGRGNNNFPNFAVSKSATGFPPWRGRGTSFNRAIYSEFADSPFHGDEGGTNLTKYRGYFKGGAALPGNSYIWTGFPLVGGEGDLLDAASVQVTDLPLATVRLTPCTAQQASQQHQQRGRHSFPHIKPVS